MKYPICNRKYIFKGSILHCYVYVRLPECNTDVRVRDLGFSGDSISSTMVRFNLPDEEKCHDVIGVFSAPFLLHHVVVHQPLIYFDLGTLGPLNIPKRFSTPPWWKGANVGERSNILVLVRTLASAKDQGCKCSASSTIWKLWKWTSSKQCRLLEIFCLWYAARDHEFLWHSFPVMKLMKCNVQASSEETPKQLPFFSRPLSHSLPTIPHRTTPELKCHPRLHSRHNIQSWSWRAAPVADLLPHVGGASVVAKHQWQKILSICGPIMKDPKRWVLQKIPVALSRRPFQKDS